MQESKKTRQKGKEKVTGNLRDVPTSLYTQTHTHTHQVNKTKFVHPPKREQRDGVMEGSRTEPSLNDAGADARSENAERGRKKP